MPNVKIKNFGYRSQQPGLGWERYPDETHHSLNRWFGKTMATETPTLPSAWIPQLRLALNREAFRNESSGSQLSSGP